MSPLDTCSGCNHVWHGLPCVYTRAWFIDGVTHREECPCPGSFHLDNPGLAEVPEALEDPWERAYNEWEGSTP